MNHTFDEEEKDFLIRQITNVMRSNMAIDANRRDNGKEALYVARIRWLQHLMTKVKELPEAN